MSLSVIICCIFGGIAVIAPPIGMLVGHIVNVLDEREESRSDPNKDRRPHQKKRFLLSHSSNNL